MYKYLKIEELDWCMLWDYTDTYSNIDMMSISKCHPDLYFKLLEKGVSNTEILKIHEVSSNKRSRIRNFYISKYYITWTVPKKHSYTWKNTLR